MASNRSEMRAFVVSRKKDFRDLETSRDGENYQLLEEGAKMLAGGSKIPIAFSHAHFSFLLQNHSPNGGPS